MGVSSLRLLYRFAGVPRLREFLHRMGREAKQGAIGLVIDRDYLEISFPLEEEPQPGGKRKKRR